jgi:hypothetical protein
MSSQAEQPELPFPPVNEPCQICHLPKQTHIDKDIIHRYVPPGAPISLESRRRDDGDDRRSRRDVDQGSVRIAQSGDPVLRMILIRAGVISVADIQRIEDELRASGAAGYDPAKTVG